MRLHWYMEYLRYINIVDMYICTYIYSCELVGLDNNLYKMHGTYIKIVLMVFTYQLIIREHNGMYNLKKNPAHVFSFSLSETHLNFLCSFTPRSPKRSFTSDFSNRTLYELLFSVIRTTFPAYLILVIWLPSQYMMRSACYDACPFAVSSIFLLRTPS
jgi:hypothetical protein